MRAGQPILVFGAKLNADGTPRPVLFSRVKAAAEYGRDFYRPLYLVSGGNPQNGVTEASCMKRMLLDLGIESSLIICEGRSVNTFQSVMFSSVLLKTLGYHTRNMQIKLVTSAYHQPRCWWLMFLAGWKTTFVPIHGMKASRSFVKCWRWRLREIPAILWDSFRFIRFR